MAIPKSPSKSPAIVAFQDFLQIFGYFCRLVIRSKNHDVKILNFADEKEINENSKNQGDKDELYQTALDLIRSEGKASTSFLQRKLQIGYNRAARIIDMMEADGIVSKANHVGKRDVL